MTTKEEGIKKEAAPRVYSEVMTVDEVAVYLQVGDRTIYKMASEGAMPATKIAGSWRFPRKAIDEWLRREALGNVKGFRFLPLRFCLGSSSLSKGPPSASPCFTR